VRLAEVGELVAGEEAVVADARPELVVDLGLEQVDVAELVHGDVVDHQGRRLVDLRSSEWASPGSSGRRRVPDQF
jgi:hypothetical protein